MVDIAGAWAYKLDPDDVGNQQHWGQAFTEDGTDFILPGSNADNGIGEAYHYDGTLSEENVQMLRSVAQYRGKIWLRKKIKLTEYRSDYHYQLSLERVMWQARLWVNGLFVGTAESLSTPQTFDITPFITADNIVTLCIDNTDIHDIDTTPSAFTEETQTIWNGAIGRLEIEESPLRVAKVTAAPSLKRREVAVHVQLAQMVPKEATLAISLRHDDDLVDQYTQTFTGSVSRDVVFTSKEIAEWNEFTPNLYRVDVTVQQDQKNIWQQEIQVGFRDWTHQGAQLMLNGKPAFLRGTIDCALFPKTGYPPMDVESWQKIFGQIKRYGFNHVRFHSWCPPKAAFEVADQLGLYLQVEGPLWLDDYMPFMVGDKADHWQFFRDESIRIIQAYGQHPSFSFFSCGNEVRGDYSLLRGIVQQLKALNPRILYTLTTNWDRELTPQDDLFMAQTVDKVPVRGQYYLDELASGTMQNYAQAVTKRSVPIISHEVGQYSIYPSMAEITKYTGTLTPTNFIAIRDDLKRKGMLQYAAQFTHDSGLLGFELYKNEVEAALRTPKMGGFQLLGLNDFTGQSTATVGILDAFWEDKGIRNAAAYRQFNNAVVPLAEFPQRIFKIDEGFTFTPKVANYLQTSQTIMLHWQVDDAAGTCLADGEQRVQQLMMGVSTLAQPVIVKFSQQQMKNQQLTLQLTLNVGDETYTNQWHLWGYQTAEKTVGATLLKNTQATDDALEHVNEGATLLLTPHQEAIRSAQPTTFFPVFWSPVHFKSKDNCGLHIDTKSALFDEFPSDTFADFQWRDLITNAYAIAYTDFDGFEPLVQVIPNFFNNRKGFVLAEFKYGRGKVLVSTLNQDGSSLTQNAFWTALERYALSDRCQPKYTISKKQLQGLFYPGGVAPKRRDIALGKVCSADSQLDAQHGPENAVNDDAQTSWQAIDHANGHWWQVDIGKVVPIDQIAIHTLAKGVYYYNVTISDDGKQFRSVVNTTANTRDSLIINADIKDNARFVRVTYGDSNDEAVIGHRAVHLY